MPTPTPAAPALVARALERLSPPDLATYNNLRQLVIAAPEGPEDGPQSWEIQYVTNYIREHLAMFDGGRIPSPVVGLEFHLVTGGWHLAATHWHHLAPGVHALLKCAPEYFQQIADGVKTYELRFNDRGYQVGDVLRLVEYEAGGRGYTGRASNHRVTQLLADFPGLCPGWVSMAIVPC